MSMDKAKHFDLRNRFHNYGLPATQFIDHHLDKLMRTEPLIYYLVKKLIWKLDNAFIKPYSFCDDSARQDYTLFHF